MIYIAINITQKTKDWETWTPRKTGSELGCSGRVGSSYSTSGTCCVTIITNPVIGHEWGKNWIVITSNGTCLWSFMTQIFSNG
jgi:hypothetical protein